MSRASRLLQVGDEVVTDFNRRGFTRHTITERVEGVTGCSSGTMFRVTPMVPGSSGDWIDADWFEPAAQASPPALNQVGGSNG